MRLFTIATLKEARNLFSFKHEDVYQAFAHLRKHPNAALKLQDCDGKQKLVWEYARRFGIRVQTRRKGDVLVIRIRAEKSTKKGAASNSVTTEHLGRHQNGTPVPPSSATTEGGGKIERMLALSAKAGKTA
jgi:hypothetical protein